MPILEAINVSKVYDSGKLHVDATSQISLAVEAGEFLAIVGRSGSGKSTLLSMLGTIETPTTGRIELEGRNISTLDDKQRTLLRRRRIGFVFQSFNLIPTLSALENVSLPLELDGILRSSARTRAVSTLDAVGMGRRRDHLPNMLSGGEQQLIAIARALVIRPTLLLADEPTGNLDSLNSETVVRLFRELVDDREQTVVMVTHDMQVAAQADRIVRLLDGRVIGDDRSSDEVPSVAAVSAASAP